MLALLLATMMTSQSGRELPGRGHSRSLARERAETIRALRYDLAFTIPSGVRSGFRGARSCDLHSARRIVSCSISRSRAITSGACASAPPTSPFDFTDGHLTIPAGSDQGR